MAPHWGISELKPTVNNDNEANLFSQETTRYEKKSTVTLAKKDETRLFYFISLSGEFQVIDWIFVV